MNIYEDYINYMNEHNELIEKLYQTSSKALLCLDDVVRVCDHIYKQSTNNETISSELEQIFEIGFGYLVNSLNDLETYYKDYLDSDIILFNQYSELLIYSLLIDDYKSYLLSNDELDNERKEAIEEMLSEIDNIVANKKSFDESLIKKYTDTLESMGYNEEFKPSYIVFAMIQEELEIY